MQLYTQVFFCAVVGDALPQLVITDVLGIDAAVDLDAVFAVVFLFQTHQFPALLVGLEVEILGVSNETVSRKGHIALHTGLFQCFGSCVGVVVEVRNGGDAKTHTLGNAQKGGCLGAAMVQLTLLLQLLLQRFRGSDIV